MDRHSIASIREVLATAKARCEDGSILDKYKTRLPASIATVERLLGLYLSSSSQKELLIPEYSTAKILDAMDKPRETKALFTYALFPEGTPKETVAIWQQHALYKDQKTVYEELREELYTIDHCMGIEIEGFTLPELIMSRPSLLITTFQTYTLHPQHPASPDYCVRLWARLDSHRRAIQTQRKMLGERQAAVQQLDTKDREAAKAWQETTDGLLEKFRGWEKEFLWGKEALGSTQ
ncbi:MAG: hypothetical protein Q9168_003566 [Polycauliona sp. 1 TL-2023]